jgi:hypothetical protein
VCLGFTSKVKVFVCPATNQIYDWVWQLTIWNQPQPSGGQGSLCVSLPLSTFLYVSLDIGLLTEVGNWAVFGLLETTDTSFKAESLKARLTNDSTSTLGLPPCVVNVINPMVTSSVLTQDCGHGRKLNCVCVFISAGPIIKLRAGGGGDREGHLL